MLHQKAIGDEVSDAKPAAPSPARLAQQARAKTPVEVTGAQSLVLSLEAMDVDTVFGIPGGAILPAYDPLLDSVKVRHILVRHEQGAGHAAEGYASATGKVGVCMATSGPGATNLVTPIADAHMDSVPMVAITGQVSSASIGTDAFQEADIRGITMPITKHNYLVTNADDIPRVIAEAFHIASTGRPGPVLVDISKDALQSRTTFAWPPKYDLPGYRPVARPHSKQIREAARLIAEAKRPVLYVGGGIIRGHASDELRTFVELTQIPVVTTLMARGAVADSHPLHLGMPGMHGSVAAVTALQKSDLLITLGARFDDRVTGQLSTFAPGAKVIHADVDPAEISKNRTADVPIVGDCKDVITDLIDAVRADREAGRTGDYDAWRQETLQWKATYPLGYSAPEDETSVAPQYVIERLGAIAGPGGDLRRRRGPAPDVGGPVRAVRAAQLLDQLGRPGHHGLRRPGGHGRQGRRAGPHRVGHRRRRLLPDDQPGAGDLRHQRHPDQGRGDQQLQPGHGAPVAVAVLQRALLQHRPAHVGRPAHPRLRQAGRGLRLRRPALRAARGRGRDHPQGHGDQRRPGGGRLRRAPRRDGLADGARRREQRRHPDRAEHDADVGEGGLMSKHTLSVLVENKPGVLARIAALFSRRGFNIDSLAVGPTEHPEISRMTVVVDVDELPLEQVTKQLNKLVEVLKVVELEGPASVQREILLVKIRTDQQSRSHVLETVQLFRAKVVDVASDALTIEVTGNRDKLNAFLEVLEPFGIKELVQSGMVAIGRGSRSITDRALRSA